jgi:D-aminopeptidase
MSCYGLKGGIGTASRAVPLPEGLFTLGVLVLTNFGRYEDFLWNGKLLAESVPTSSLSPEKDMGSVIVVIALDAPLSERQLGRLSRRAVSGLSRTGAYIASGSGEIVLAFTTGRRIPHDPPVVPIKEALLHEDRMDAFFQASTEAVEEAVLDSMLSAATVRGRDGNVRFALRDLLRSRGSEPLDGTGR